MKSRFIIDDRDLCYLDGNSLGRLPRAAAERVSKLVHEGWGRDLIRGWNADWIHLPQRIGGKLATILGCQPEEVILADSTSVNLFKLATSALNASSNRNNIVTDATNFPSDLHILESAARAAYANFEIRVVGQSSDILFPEKSVLDAIDEGTALVCLTHAAFRSAALADMKKITAASHENGALVLWDLSHSVGAVPIDLHGCNADLAVGCTYKYLCGGPGAPAFLYVRHDLQRSLDNPIHGWFSHRKPFDFGMHYQPAESIEKFLSGTPPVISLAAIEAGVDLVLEAGMDSLRERSIELTSLLVDLYDRQLAELGYQLRSPREASQRGSHISLGHPQAHKITANLIDRHRVIPDFRTPDNIRLGIAPLYTTEDEIRHAVDALDQSVRSEEYLHIELSDAPVT